MKPNYWPAAACIGPLLLTRERLSPLAKAAALAAALVSGLAWSQRYDLLGMLDTYLGLLQTRAHPVASRAFMDLGPAQELLTRIAEWLLVGIYAVAAQRALARPAGPPGAHPEPVPLWREGLSIGAVALAVGAYGIETNKELKLCDLCLMCFGAALPVALLRGQLPGALRRATVVVLCYMLLASLYSGVSRERVRAAGRFKFYQADAAEIQRQPFFAGCSDGELFQRTLDQLTRLVGRNPGKSIFFGSRLEFAYAAYQLPSPRGLPLSWYEAKICWPEREPELIRRWRALHYDIVVFRKHDRWYMDWIDQELSSFSEDDVTYPLLAVYVRRSSGDAPGAPAAPP
jgi:hypothetical protein